MKRSFSPTCSLSAVVFTSVLTILSETFSNSMSIITTFTKNTFLPYNFTILFRPLLSCIAVQVGIYSAVNITILLDKVIKNGKPFTNITSAVNVTNLWRTWKYLGIGMYSLSTHVGLDLTDFPLIPATFGPNTLFALVMCSSLTGQFSKSFSRAMFLKSASDGWPTLAYNFRAKISASTYFFV